MTTFQDLTEEVTDESVLPPLDRKEIDEAKLDRRQKCWREEGVLVLPNFLPEELMERYSALRARLKIPGGWASPVPYMHYSEIKDICLYRPLMEVMSSLIGAEMGLHLNLTGWISTERSWHQDDYLNPEHVMAHYLAVWMALDEVDPDSGPFEYVPGSHKWPLLRREKVLNLMEKDALKTSDWPTRAEEFVTPACEGEIARRGAEVKQFIGKKGDVLIWHGRLLHQGSKPKVPGRMRKALISHYSAVTHRPDMPQPVLYENSLGAKGHFFPIPLPLAEWEKV